MRNDYLVLSWDLVQTLRALFPNDMHRAVAARASRALRFDRDMNMRKMRRQRTAVDASLLTLIRWFVGCAILLRLFRISVGKCGLDIFQCQLHLIAIKLFGPLTKLSTLELLQQMSKLIILLRQPPALGNGRVALARQLAHQSPQGIEIVCSSVDRHARD
jgi:hypothetical protein